jgi:hypothetical protein
VTNVCALGLRRLLNVNLQTVVWQANTLSPAVVVVPAGRTIQFFCATTPDVSGTIYLRLKRDAQTLYARIVEGDPLEGPLTLEFDSQFLPSFTPWTFVSYWFVENAFENPNAKLSLGAGVPAILAEKSSDLTNWQPVATFGGSIGTNAFYRLKILR